MQGSHQLAQSWAPAEGSSERSAFPLALPARGAPRPPRGGAGAAGAQAERTAAGEEGCPGESCQGNLSNSSAPVPTFCIIHRRWRPDAGAAPLRPPGPHTPAGERGSRGRAPGGSSARPRRLGRQTRQPSAGTRSAGTGSPTRMLQFRAPGEGRWGWGWGDRSGVSRDLAQWQGLRPLAAPRPLLLLQVCWPTSPRGRRRLAAGRPSEGRRLLYLRCPRGRDRKNERWQGTKRLLLHSVPTPLYKRVFAPQGTFGGGVSHHLVRQRAPPGSAPGIVSPTPSFYGSRSALTRYLVLLESRRTQNGSGSSAGYLGNTHCPFQRP